MTDGRLIGRATAGAVPETAGAVILCELRADVADECHRPALARWPWSPRSAAAPDASPRETYFLYVSRKISPSAAPLSPRPGWASATWDLVVVGGGNAAVSAAMAADDRGASVLILERAPVPMRGGNTRHTRNIRCVHRQDQFNSGDYCFDELWADLCGVGTGPSDEELAHFTVSDSETIPAW